MARALSITGVVAFASLCTGCRDVADLPAPVAGEVAGERRASPDEFRFDHVPPTGSVALGPVIRGLTSPDDSTRRHALGVIRDLAPRMSPDSRRTLVPYFALALESGDSARVARARAVFGVLCPADGWLEASLAVLLNQEEPAHLRAPMSILRLRVQAGDPECSGKRPRVPRGWRRPSPLSLSPPPPAPNV